jgi:hypothetical protein
MLDRLQRHAQQLDGYTELRWHANHATRLAMRKGALLQNSQSREGGVSARCRPGHPRADEPPAIGGRVPLERNVRIVSRHPSGRAERMCVADQPRQRHRAVRC